MNECVIAIDLGGTNVRAAIVNQEGILHNTRTQAPSNAQQGVQQTIQTITNIIGQTTQNKITPKRIGIAVPGHIDTEKGVVLWAPNFGEYKQGRFESWKNIPLAQLIEKQTGIPVSMGNDANLAALGEYQFGSGQNKAHSLFLFTLGTGVGSGLATKQHHYIQPFQGYKGGAIEFGHTIIKYNGRRCSCGSKGCIEAYCSAKGLLVFAKQYGIKKPTSPKEIAELANQKNRLAIQVWMQYAEYLGIAIANAINTFAPQIVAIGGQIALAHQYFLPHATKIAQQQAVRSIMQNTQIVIAQQIQDAGILGAACIALSS